MKYVIVVLCLFFSANVYGQSVAQHLQDVSVMVDTSTGSGSGMLITRDLQTTVNSKEMARVNFVWTAAHVVASLRSVRSIVDEKSSQEKKIIEFSPVFMTKDFIEEGRKVGEIRLEGKVIKYSDAKTGHDLALIMLLKKNYVNVTTKFYLETNKIVDVGNPLFHIGSLHGSPGSNSMTNGLLSQVGRVSEPSPGNVVVLDQTSCPSFPGSSGGGVFTHDGKCIGMLVSGIGETFNFIVPVRRMYQWTKEQNILWAIDEKAPRPTLDELRELKVEDIIK